MNDFTTGTIDLSMTNPDTGLRLQANVYYVDGVVDSLGAPRPLSMIQLVMALCLARATELEAEIVAEMEAMAENTERLDYYSKIETDMANWYESHPEKTFDATTLQKKGYENLYELIHRTEAESESSGLPTFDQFLEDVGEEVGKRQWTYDEFEKFMTRIEDRMDTYNTMSQEQLISIQTMTSKRDDTYSLISNVIKSLNTVLTGTVNNL